MTIYDLKPAFVNLLYPVSKRLSTHGVTANTVTVSALLLSFAQAAAIVLSGGAAWSLWLLPLTLFVRMALNAIDGTMAREFGMKSRKGAYLNELCDILSDAALYLAMAVLAGVNVWAVFLFTLGAVVSEYAGLLGWAVSGERRYDGPFGKSDRAFFIALAAILYATGLIDGEILTILFAAAAALTVPTTLNRVKGGLA